jgi:hypothetical protein
MTHKPGAFYLTKISVQQNNELAGFCIELTVFDVFLFLAPTLFLFFLTSFPRAAFPSRVLHNALPIPKSQKSYHCFTIFAL